MMPHLAVRVRAPTTWAYTRLTAEDRAKALEFATRRPLIPVYGGIPAYSGRTPSGPMPRLMVPHYGAGGDRPRRCPGASGTLSLFVETLARGQTGPRRQTPAISWMAVTSLLGSPRRARGRPADRRRCAAIMQAEAPREHEVAAANARDGVSLARTSSSNSSCSRAGSSSGSADRGLSASRRCRPELARRAGARRVRFVTPVEVEPSRGAGRRRSAQQPTCDLVDARPQPRLRWLSAAGRTCP